MQSEGRWTSPFAFITEERLRRSEWGSFTAQQIYVRDFLVSRGSDKRRTTEEEARAKLAYVYRSGEVRLCTHPADLEVSRRGLEYLRSNLYIVYRSIRREFEVSASCCWGKFRFSFLQIERESGGADDGFHHSADFDQTYNFMESAIIEC